MSERLDKLESAVKKLAGDVGAIRGEQKAQSKQLNQLGQAVGEGFGEVAASLKELQRTQSALANGMTAAMKQLAVDKSLELRMQRVEEAVFGSKH